MAINQEIPQAKKVKVELISNLDDWEGVTGPVDQDLRQVVVQKATINGKYTYALQHVAGDTFVYRGRTGKNVAFNKRCPRLTLTKKAAGHTQTLITAGKFGQWFIGTSPNDSNQSAAWSNWSKQIARVGLVFSHRYQQAVKMPRLVNLNHAGDRFGLKCANSDFARVEAAVSPDYRYFLLAYGDNEHNGYFALYYLREINYALDHATAAGKEVDISKLNCLAAFMIPNMSGKDGQVGSLQGFDLDHYLDQNRHDQFEIYLSSQPFDDRSGQDRKIIKIPWGEKQAPNWQLVNLTKETSLEIAGYYTEVEGIQLLNKNDVYLTVAYHQKVNLPNLTKHPTKINKVYRVSWAEPED